MNIEFLGNILLFGEHSQKMKFAVGDCFIAEEHQLTWTGVDQSSAYFIAVHAQVRFRLKIAFLGMRVLGNLQFAPLSVLLHQSSAARCQALTSCLSSNCFGNL